MTQQITKAIAATRSPRFARWLSRVAPLLPLGVMLLLTACGGSGGSSGSGY